MTTIKQISQSDQQKNIYNRTQRITGFIEKQRKYLSAKNLETFLAIKNRISYRKN